MDPQEPIATEAHLPATAEVAGVFLTNREAFESGLVILAMNVPYWHVHEDHEHRLYVEGEVLTLVKEELAMFRDENATWTNATRNRGIIGSEQSEGALGIECPMDS